MSKFFTKQSEATAAKKPIPKVRSSSPDSEVRRLQTRLRKTETELDYINNSFAKATAELNALRADKTRTTALEQEFERVLSLDAAKQSETRRTEESLKRQHANEMGMLKHEMDDVCAELANRCHRIEMKYKTELKEQESTHQREKGQMDRLFHDTKDKMANKLKEQASAHNMEQERAYTMLDEQEANFREKLKEQEVLHQEEQQQMASKFLTTNQNLEADLDARCKGYNSEIQDLKKAHTEDLMTAYNQAEININDLEVKHAQEIDAIRAAGEEKLEQLRKDLLQEIKMLDTTLFESKARHQEDKEKVCANYEAQMARLEEDVMEQKEEMEARIADKEIEQFAKIESQERAHQEQIAAYQAASQGKMTVHGAEHKGASERQLAENNALIQQIEAVKLELKEATMQFATFMEQHNKELEVLDQEHAAEITAIIRDRDECEAQLEKSQSRINQILGKHTADIENIKQDHKKQLSTINDQHQEVLETRLFGSETKLRKTVKGHHAQIQQLGQKHNENVAHMTQELEKLTTHLKDREQTEDHYKMLLADEKAKRKNAVRRFQEIRNRLIIIEEQRSLEEDSRQ